MDFFKEIFVFIFGEDDEEEADFGDYDENYYLSKPNKKLSGDSLDGGEVYEEPDYVLNDT